MKRILVDVGENDIAELDALASERGVSRASVLREAVAEYLTRNDKGTSQPKPLEGFGILKGRLDDGLALQDELRREWE